MRAIALRRYLSLIGPAGYHLTSRGITTHCGGEFVEVWIFDTWQRGLVPRRGRPLSRSGWTRKIHLCQVHRALSAQSSHCRTLRWRSANSYVRSQGTRQRLSVPTDSGSVSRNGNWLHRVGDGALRRRSIKLLFAGSAFRVSVSGLVLCLNGGRRAQPGHVVRDRGSPPWLHPRRCAALRFLLSTASTAGSSMDAISREHRAGLAFARQQRPAGSAVTGVALSNTPDNRTRASCVLSGSFAGSRSCGGRDVLRDRPQKRRHLAGNCGNDQRTLFTDGGEPTVTGAQASLRLPGDFANRFG